MCGIAGVLYKKGSGPVGEDLKRLVYGIRHRGRDSSGVAIFSSNNGAGGNERLLIHVRVGSNPSPQEIDAVLSTLEGLLEEEGGEILDHRVAGTILGIGVQYSGSVRKLCYRLDRYKVQTISIGYELVIYKDLGTADRLDVVYHYSRVEGTHGIGHARLATESMVSPDRAHPFWAYGFADIAIVHNGQLTNYWKMRRHFERKGYRFRTDNDSELIAIYNAHYLEKGMKLQDVLEQSLLDLDGTYTFLVATPGELGFVRDKLAAKPLVYVDTADRVVLASEEIGLRALLPDMESMTVEEPLPRTAATWSIDGGRQLSRLTYRAVGME
ncbi:MAG TPA: amidophosphoribosyltransferase [Desulfotomaculum sp.]|nr:amidophosphoribosyltransferase [Desulfotomaculum sp.]